MAQKPKSKDPRRKRGFERAGGLLAKKIRTVGEGRGFAVSKVLTHWAEIVGQDVAQIAHPVDVSYARGGFGATLTVLTTGAQAPMLEMQKETIRERVNACYGYTAIRRIHITQTAPTGFSQGRISFAQKPKPPAPPVVTEAARATAAPIQDAGLRDAIERLAANVISRNKQH